MIFPSFQALVGGLICNEIAYEIGNLVRINKISPYDINNFNYIINNILLSYKTFVSSSSLDHLKDVTIPTIVSCPITYLNKETKIVGDKSVLILPKGFMTSGFIFDENRVVIKNMNHDNFKVSGELSMKYYEECNFAIKNTGNLSISYSVEKNEIEITMPSDKLVDVSKYIVSDSIQYIRFPMPLLKNLKLERIEKNRNVIKVYNLENDSSAITQVKDNGTNRTSKRNIR